MSLIQRTNPRDIYFTPCNNPHAAGSIIVEFGHTKIHITASVENEVPRWMKGQGQGWITGEYSMLPASTHTRSRRERSKISGRTQEIQRLIGRCLRSIVDLKQLGERTIIIDCDVLVADGGTRTAALSGGYVALISAVRKLVQESVLKKSPITHQLAAISVGIDSKNKIIADLNYQEDSSCQVDMNVVMTRDGDLVEVQGTAEQGPFSMESFHGMIECARTAIEKVFEAQDRVLL